jgi:hypothetical protein
MSDKFISILLAFKEKKFPISDLDPDGAKKKFGVLAHLGLQH